MWTDNDTDRDFVNFTGVADTVAEIILSANGEPVSIGVSGEWGVGKSTMIRLIRRSLDDKMNTGGDEASGAKSKYLFVNFNAWLYQGYDDARAALMEVIAKCLAEEAKRSETAVDKALGLLKRVNVVRLVGLTAGTAASLAMGLPPVGLLGQAWALMAGAKAGPVTTEAIEGAVDTGEKLGNAAGGLLNPAPSHSPPEEIQALRNEFEETLRELKITLVVLIDDLDRCLPNTTISTLEAIRLFLFLPHTAFVIAADDAMIKHAVRQHFNDLDGSLVTSYFDKLIQVPVRVPPLGTQEVWAYMAMLFVDKHVTDAAKREAFRKAVCLQLTKSWQGERVDQAYLETLKLDMSPKLRADLSLADRLAPLLTTSPMVKGNPRLIKRFLNALSIRQSVANRYGVTVDPAALVKMLLFERCGEPAAYRQIAEAVNASEKGHPAFLSQLEAQVAKGEPAELNTPWDNDFSRSWLSLEPMLATVDLRGILYLSREHMQVVSPQDRLTSEGANVLEAILKQPSIAATMTEQIKRLPTPDRAIIVSKLVAQAHQEQRWGAPDSLKALMAFADVDQAHARSLAAFLSERPLTQLEASIVPLLASKPWAAEVLKKWEDNAATPKPVKNAIANTRKVT